MIKFHKHVCEGCIHKFCQKLYGVHGVHKKQGRYWHIFLYEILYLNAGKMGGRTIEGFQYPPESQTYIQPCKRK